MPWAIKGKRQVEFLFVQLLPYGQGMVATGCTVHGSYHAEDVFCHYVYSSPDLGSCCLTTIVDSGELEHVEAISTEVDTGMVVADTRLQQHTYRGSMA